MINRWNFIPLTDEQENQKVQLSEALGISPVLCPVAAVRRHQRRFRHRDGPRLGGEERSRRWHGPLRPSRRHEGPHPGRRWLLEEHLPLRRPPRLDPNLRHRGHLGLFNRVQRTNCQRTTPTETETLRECLVPHWGISRTMSEASTTSWRTPSTSLPNTSA